MADDKVSVFGGQIRLGRAPANGELLIGDGENFTLANITAGAGATVTNTPGGIEIAATGTGISTVTASSPLASSGGSAPDISLTGVVSVANGGTGASTLTTNNVLIGNGTSAVGFVAPGASGNVLTSDGTTWASAAAPRPSRVLIETKSTPSGSTVSFTDIPQTYNEILVVLTNVVVGVNTTAITLAASSDNGSSYTAAVTSSNNVAVGVALNGSLKIGTYSLGGIPKYYDCYTVGVFSGNPTNYGGFGILLFSAGFLSPINALRVGWTSSGTFNGGSISLYGV